MEVASRYFRAGADKISLGSDAVYAAEVREKRFSAGKILQFGLDWKRSVGNWCTTETKQSEPSKVLKVNEGNTFNERTGNHTTRNTNQRRSENKYRYCEESTGVGTHHTGF